jgi:hypothetical protein
MAKRKINKKALARRKPRPDQVERAENAFLAATSGVPALG